MKIEMKAVIKDLKGIEFREGDKILTVADVIMNALLSQTQEEAQSQTGDQKVQFYKLAKKVVEGVEDFSIEDAALFKARVGKIYPPIIVGFVFELLDGK